jgi:hypothetical protein
MERNSGTGMSSGGDTYGSSGSTSSRRAARADRN